MTFEHPYVNASFDYLWATDQPRAASPKLDSNGYSVWATPKTTKGWEALLRYDHLDREQAGTSVKGVTGRTIAGVSYWFPRQGNVSTVLLFDYEQVNFDDFATVRPDEDPLARQRRVIAWHPLRALNAMYVRVWGADLLAVHVQLALSGQRTPANPRATRALGQASAS